MIGFVIRLFKPFENELRGVDGSGGADGLIQGAPIAFNGVA